MGEKRKPITRTVAAITICLALLFSCLSPAAAETLADIDAVIQAGDKTLVRVPGQDAYNVYQGIDTTLLDRKITVLNAAGIANFASAGHYGNFYSFTGLAGVTDTKIDLVTTASAARFYRRGKSSVLETQSYLGSWWTASYQGTQATRDGLAVLAAWGSDLNRIYVIEIPAATTLIGGLASPMEKDGEYRAGGSYQYYYRGVPLSWLIYALYAPDYLKSYAAAVTGAQKLGRSGLEDLGGHLDDLRYRTLIGNPPQDYSASQDAEPAAYSQLTRTGDKMALRGGNGAANAAEPANTWLRFYGGYTRQNDDSGQLGQQSRGLHAGWENLIKGGTAGEKDRWHIGALLGQGFMSQNAAASGVKNDITNTYAGLYSLYQSRPDQPRSWYGSATLIYGRLKFTNQVPGELGHGLNQTYFGNIFAASLENGLTYRRPDGWFVEPQLQLLYTKILQGDFADDLGATVAVRRSQSLVGRLGLMVLRKTESKAGLQTKLWARASYQREFCGNNTVDVAGDVAVSGGGRNTYLVNIGADCELNRRLSIRGDIAKLFGDERGYRGSLSLQYLL